MTDHDSIALITGATSGIGAATARRLISDGYRVIAAGRRRDRLNALAEEAGDRCLPLCLDVTDGPAVARAVAELPDAFRQITTLINNAGVSLGNAPAHQAKLSDWETTVATNVNGLLYSTHAVLPGMVERNFGDIINIGSIGATHPYPRNAVYGGTKAFTRQFTTSLRADLLGTNIRAACIEPGIIETEFAYVRMGDAARAFYDRPNLLKAEDIAELIHVLLTLPRRVNIDTMEVMPLVQSYGYPTLAKTK
jgi:3-hydroxy acid dehydrogenase/malonic semialdehyde reductase